MKKVMSIGCLLLILISLAGCTFIKTNSTAIDNNIEENPQNPQINNNQNANVLNNDNNVSENLNQPNKEEQSSDSNNTDDNYNIHNDTDKIQAYLDNMTLEQKVGQLFIIRPEVLDTTLTQKQVNALYNNKITELSDSMIETLKQYPVGGIIMFSKNISSPEQITEFNKSLQFASDIPLFISVDEEGGIVARLANNDAFDLPTYDSAASVGASQNSSDAKVMGQVIGKYLNKYGFNLDFAPVADVNTNPDNPVIGTRAFSSDANIVAEMSGAMAEGLKENNIIPVFKHFPGHGDTKEDSHVGIAVTNKSINELEECEWLPYNNDNIENYAVMVGHIAVPNVTGDMTPSSLSSIMITDNLRDKLGFKGLVITDSLSMGAIVEGYSAGDASIKALQAGCDILLMPYGLTDAYEAVLNAVKDGTISEERLNESVHRILSYKVEYGVLKLD